MRTYARVIIALLVVVGAWRTWGSSPPEDEREELTARMSPPAASATWSQESPLDASTVVVPRLTGLSGGYARDLLHSSGLRLGEIRLRASLGPWGAVLSQSIEAGVRVPRGTEIRLVLVRGSIPRCWPLTCGIPHGRSRPA
jgi:hypothetical protein